MCKRIRIGTCLSLSQSWPPQDPTLLSEDDKEDLNLDIEDQKADQGVSKMYLKFAAKYN